jgi:iron(III) transport system substrate-binding protein
VISRLLTAFVLSWMTGVHADDPGGNPGTAAAVVNAARLEGRLVIYSVIHADAATHDLLAAFHRRYPFISVVNSDDDASRTYQRFRREVMARQPSADFIWSPAMDLQEKLVNDGFSRSYASPEMGALPAWAHWQSLGYGVTQEPIAIVYNSRYLAASEMPNTHVGLRDMLQRQSHRLYGKVALYDPQASEVGMLLMSQDVRVTSDSWNLFATLGAVDARQFNTSRDILASIVRGDQWIGYDVIASYAEELRKTHPELVVVYPSDYTLLLSRVAFVTATAAHPNCAKLFLDFLLSREGQSILRDHGMGPVRNDVAPLKRPGLHLVRAQAIRIGPGLLSDLDSLVRAQFLRRWPRGGRSAS